MKKILLTLLVGISQLGFAQQGVENKVLFTIDNKPFYTDEFVRVYNKNLDLVKDDSQKNLDTYLDLYLGYKLKVEKGRKLSLNESPKYINELKSYRNQLTKTYLNDAQVTNALVEEAYNRTQNEVRASHILVMVSEDALPNDTIAAYTKIKEIYTRVKKGENFDVLAEKYSEDPSAKVNKGDLGYFSAFKMVYPFENAAYNTKVGNVSEIFRTRFGYHFLKVTEFRKNRGDVQVAHIMLLNSSTDESKNKTNEQVIKDIYKKIEQGESFEELARQFSDDKSTAPKGGELQRFSAGQLTSQEFETVAFELKDKGEVSKPFQSQFGWHIIKLIGKFPVPSLDEMKSELENKIRRDERSLLITNSLVSKLRSKYSYESNAKLLASIKKIVTEDFYIQGWKQPENLVPFEQTLVTINKEKQILATSFLKYIESQQKSNIKIKPINALIDTLFDKWLNDQLTQYYDDNLENEFADFRYVMNEYREGLLLFDLMEKEIWEKAKSDSIGLQNFYENNKQNYKWNKRYNVDIYSSTDKATISKTQKFLKKKKTAEDIKAALNSEEKVNVMVKSGVFEADYEALPEMNIKKTGITNIVNKGNYTFVAMVNEILLEDYKTIDECKGKLISDYQQYLENNWVAELKKEFNVAVNTDVFNALKAKMNK